MKPPFQLLEVFELISHSENTRKPSTSVSLISEFASPPPQFFIYILFQSSQPLVFKLLISRLVSYIDFHMSVEEFLGIGSEGLAR